MVWSQIKTHDPPLIGAHAGLFEALHPWAVSIVPAARNEGSLWS